MPQFHEAEVIAPITTGNLTDHIEENARVAPDALVLSRPAQDGWVDLSATEVRNQIRSVAKGLIASGIQPGDRVAIFSRNCLDWTLADYAIWYAGAITVPIYDTSSPSQVEWIMSDGGVVATFFESPRATHSYNQVADKLPDMKQRFVFTEGALTELAAKGQSVTDAQLDVVRTRATPNDPATLIYTSGTTGQPKGCILTHGNVMSEVDILIESVPEVFQAPGGCTLLFLPLAHIFGRVIQVAFVRGRVRFGHVASPATLLKDVGVYHPTFLLAVPRIFERVYNGANAKAHGESAIKGRIFDVATATAIAYSEAIEKGHIPALLKLRHALMDKLVFAKIRHLLGGKVVYAISGGSALGTRLGHYYRGLGIHVLEGYGLTETTAALTLNRPGLVQIGSVGRPIPGTTIRIADDGEVLAKGPQVFPSYWHNEQATAETFTDDGWYRTGDLGRLDEDGFLYITGRKKELIVTAAGKNVAPIVLEDRLRANPIVSQCVVVGDDRPYIAALITLDQDALPGILEANGIETAPLEQLVHDARVRALVQVAVNEANEVVSNSEAIKRFVILPTDWTIENGFLTPKLSIKRHLVHEAFAKDIEELYR